MSMRPASGVAPRAHAHLGLIERRLAERDQAALDATASPRRSRWLAGIALPCNGDDVGRAATQKFVDQFAGPHFHVRLNIYDRNSSCVPSHRYVAVSHVPGYMTVFWKRILVPQLTRNYDRIFILDNDVQLSPAFGFSLSAVDRWLAHTGAFILQPSVIGATRAKRSGTGVRAHGAFTADCVAYMVPSIERVHISRPEAYEVLWDILDSIPDERLSTDTALMHLWVSLVCERFPGHPSAVVVQSIAAAHLDTHTIRKAGLDPFYNHPSHKKVNVLFYMHEHPVYGQYVNGSATLRLQQRCGRPARIPEDLGMASSKGRKAARGSSTAASAEEPVKCWSGTDAPWTTKSLYPRPVSH